MASFFERLFGPKEEEKRPEAPPGGLVEFFRPAQPPALLSEDLFHLLAPLPPAFPAEIPASARYEILAPPPPAAAQPRTLTEAFFPEGPLPPEESRPRDTGPGFFDLFTEQRDPWDVERERRGIVPKARLARIVDLGEILAMVKEGRKDPDFQRDVRKTLRGKPPAELPLLRLATEERGAEDKVADFLGIPRTDIGRLERERKDPWPTLLNPLLFSIERGLEWYLGDQVPGVFHFGVNSRGEFGLFYLEDHPDL